MRRSPTVLVLVILFGLLATCCKPNSVKTPNNNSVTKNKTFNPTDVIRVAGIKLHVRIARTEAEQERGLMFISSLAENTGMLFIFKQERFLSFWMKNTYIPLSIGFFDREGTLVDIREMKALSTYPPTISKVPAIFALEVNLGWFKRHKVTLGAKLELN